MRLGLIARADSRGLGIQCKAFHDNMHPAKTMVIDCPSAKPLPLRRDWYPDATWINGLPTRGDFREWLQDLDVVYTAETAYGPHLWSEADRAGVKTVLHANYEFLNRDDRPTLWAMPSMWHYDDVPFRNKTFLPVPVETDRFTEQRGSAAKEPPGSAMPSRTAVRFLHVVGRPAHLDRNGTADLLDALEYVESDVTVTIKCQQGGYVSSLRPTLQTRKNVTLIIDPGDVDNYWDLYTGHDVLIMPRRFGGLCLPVNEALAAGMPVVMPDISPNNTWIPSEWLVPAHKAGSFTVKRNLIDYYNTDVKALAEKIDLFAQNPGFHRASSETASRMATDLSWTALKPLYLKTFEELVDV